MRIIFPEINKTLCVCLLISLFLLPPCLFAQRYLALTLVNENDQAQLQTIQNARNVGCNAVALSVSWGSIHGKLSRILKSENSDSYNLWKQYDDQIAFAVSLGMKVALNICVSTADDVTHSSTDRYGINTGDGWLKEERILVANYGGEEAVFQKYGGEIRPGVYVQFVMTSLQAQSTKDRIVSFTDEVIRRYKYLQDAGNLLYVNLIYTRTGEGEYEIGSTKYNFDTALDMGAALSDYSAPMTTAYRGWLTGKYGKIEYLNAIWGKTYSSFDQITPKKPSGSTFSEPDGVDWYLFRTETLKVANQLFKNAVKNVSPDIKVISHHGSVFDKLSRGRGTFSFDEVGAGLDGIKINDDTNYDHRFALDLLRTNMPGKFYANEVHYTGDITLAERLAKESFTHGANMVAIFNFDAAISDGKGAALTTLANDWVKNQAVTLPTASNTDNFNLSNLISNDGCSTNRDSYSTDCDAYKNWRSAYNNAGSKPVNIFKVDDLNTFGCFYKDLKPSVSGDQVSNSIGSAGRDYHLTQSDCRVIGTIRGTGLSGTNPLASSVTIESQVKSYNGKPYVQRHFRFVPGGNSPSGITLTLYVSQQELTAFNTQSSTKLPANSTDNTGKGNLRILQWNSATIAGEPNTTINPDDANIQWDSVLGMWRITFTPTTLSTFAISAADATPLPVSLTSFSAGAHEGTVDLRWKTSDETNSSYFDVQHSQSGKQWTSLDRINAAYESSVEKNYTYLHQNPAPGQNLYRLKMVDKDETFSYSRIVSVSLGVAAGISLYPNPVSNGTISVRYQGERPEVMLTNLLGREIPVTTEVKGSQVLTVRSCMKLAAGIYVLTTGQGENKIRHKIIVNN